MGGKQGASRAATGGSKVKKSAAGSGASASKVSRKSGTKSATRAPNAKPAAQAKPVKKSKAPAARSAARSPARSAASSRPTKAVAPKKAAPATKKAAAVVSAATHPSKPDAKRRDAKQAGTKAPLGARAKQANPPRAAKKTAKPAAASASEAQRAPRTTSKTAPMSKSAPGSTSTRAQGAASSTSDLTRPSGAVVTAAPRTARSTEPAPALPTARLPGTAAEVVGAFAEERAQPAPAAAAISPFDVVVEGPRGPWADHTTEDLWVLYRNEAERLRTGDQPTAADGDDELDEEAELRRLEAEERAEREREAALDRGEDPEASAPAPDVAPETVVVQRTSGRKERNSPELERLRNELIERHYPLVRYIAERLLQTLPKSIELDDLISAGQFGLMDAIRGFDPTRGIKFKTYCSTRIRGSILDQLRSQDWVPRLVRLKATRIDKALQRLTGEFGREPTHAELARSLELEHGDLSREIMESQARTMFSLSEKWDDDDEGSVEKVEILEDRAAVDPVHELNRRDLMVFMTRSLTHKERFIIEQYYQYGHTMREIGEMLTLTESRVCQIHSNVMGRLKNLLSQRGDSLSN